MTTSQDWWPADYGHYGPLFIRMAWHSAGTYRISDGRGGGGSGDAALRAAQQLARQREPRQGAPAALAGQAEVRPEDLLGRPDDLRRQLRAGVDGLQDLRLRRRARGRLGARGHQLGRRGHVARRRALQRRPGACQPARRRADGPDLREPGRPERQPGPARRGAGHPRDVPPHGHERRGDRRAHRRRPHVRQDARCGDPNDTSAPSPRARPCEQQGLGWKNSFGTGTGGDAITSGLEGAWTTTPITWDNSFFDTLFGYEWELTKSPAGAQQWIPTDPAAASTVPDAHDPAKRHAPVMLTTDLALRMDPIYEPISRRFHENPQELADAFAKAWFKLTHRDMGPIARYLGPLVPAEPQLWQDPVPAVTHELIGAAGHRRPQGHDPRLGTVRLTAGRDRVGLGVDVPRHRQARRRQRRAHPPGAAERLGGQQPRRAGEGAADARGDPAGVQQRAGRREAGLARRPDRARRVRSRRAGGEERRTRRRGSLHAWAHGRVAGADRRGVLRRARADRRRVPQLPRQGTPRPAEHLLVDRAQPADADRARDDGARRRPARPERELRPVQPRRVHRAGPGR